MRLGDLTWTEVAARARATTLAVPVGSTEQHGPHLPLLTDTFIAVELASRLANARADVAIAPAVPYGSSGEHAGFPGTLSIGGDALELLLVELGRSSDDFAGIVFISTHGGNAASVRAATDRLCNEGRRASAWSPSVKVPGGDAHAGFTETSVMMALFPDQRLEPVPAGCVTPLSELMPVLTARGVKAVSESGVLGDPAGASASAGEAILDAWTADLISHLAGWP
jgi:mycofactocin system creatininase family protein